MKITKIISHPSLHLIMRKDASHSDMCSKSPVYPLPDDSTENAEFSSIPDLETPREQMDVT